MTVIMGENYRITLLTSRLIRLEYQPEGKFTDEMTTFARCRDFPEVSATQKRSARGLEVDTEHLHLFYNEKPFSAAGLSVELKGGLTHFMSVWHFGDPIRSLGGTARTLDNIDGKTDVDTGVVSFFGFSVIDDSASMLLDEEAHFCPRPWKETDLYFFGYGHDYAACLRDLYTLSGQVPLIPRFALGNWWSRYHEYSEKSYLNLMDRFEKAGIPLSVAVIDMDWHVTANPYSSGWTGYTWNRSLFPDPERFLKKLHEKGLYTTLNLHPADGVAAHEQAYVNFCAWMGQNPDEKQKVDFDPTDEHFMEGYFRLLHHPLEEQGVDFWWIDWQQGGVCSVEGLDPLWVLNEKHYRDILRKGKRGLILSRYAGPGSHRCPVGFSGDTITTWESLDFQPRFTAMASNIGYPWWSHDIGGHMRGIRSDELSVRWLQFGVFSPILRLHSSKSEFMSKEPWAYGMEAEQIMSDLLRLRHRLVPYLYTAMERTHRLGEPLIRSMYYAWPDRMEAYQTGNQYLFGTELMVCPITRPMEPELALAGTEAWLPEGIWLDFFTGQIYTGGRQLTLWRALKDFPVLAAAGSIVPLSDEPRADQNPAKLTLRVFAGKSNAYSLYEDDGTSLEGSAVRTNISLDWEAGELTFRTEGDLSLIPSRRSWRVECIGFAETSVSCGGMPLETVWDSGRNMLCFTLETASDSPEVKAVFGKMEIVRDDWLARTKERLQATQSSNDEKHKIWHVLERQERNSTLPGTLQTICTTPNLYSCLLETIFAQDNGS